MNNFVLLLEVGKSCARPLCTYTTLSALPENSTGKEHQLKHHDTRAHTHSQSHTSLNTGTH